MGVAEGAALSVGRTRLIGGPHYPWFRATIRCCALRRFGDTLGKWFADELVRLGIRTQAGERFHTLRHTMKDALREADVDKELRDRLMGHAAGDEAANYGRGASLMKAREAINLVYRELTNQA